MIEREKEEGSESYVRDRERERKKSVVRAILGTDI